MESTCISVACQSPLEARSEERVLPESTPLASETEPLSSMSGRRVTIIEPDKGWRLLNIAELWRYRELMYFLVWRDVKVRYKQTALGVIWAVLQPALMMVVFTVFVARVTNVPTGPIRYPLFVYAGVLPWTFFAAAVANAANSVIGSERLITKIYFPRLSIPFAAVCAATVDWAAAMGLLVGLMAWYGVVPSANIILLPFVFIIVALFAAGLGTLLAALNVAYRDFRYVVPFLLQVGMFATPAIYLEPGSSDGHLGVLGLNPFNSLVMSFRASVLGGPIPWTALGGASIVAILMFLAGCLYFRRVEDSFSDVI